MRAVLVLTIVAIIGGCATGGSPEGANVIDSIELPPPVLLGGELVDALSQRRSVRDYDPTPLSPSEVSQLLWAAQGVTSEPGRRTAPSAGGLYPLEVYLVTADGWYHYVPDGHYLEVMGKIDLRGALASAALSQTAVATAPAVFVITAVYSRTEQKYGDRAERYVELEAGHAAQNLLLQAVSLGLGAVPIGAFGDSEVQQVVGLQDDHEPLYLIPVGHPGG